MKIRKASIGLLSLSLSYRWAPRPRSFFPEPRWPAPLALAVLAKPRQRIGHASSPRARAALAALVPWLQLPDLPSPSFSFSPLRFSSTSRAGRHSADPLVAVPSAPLVPEHPRPRHGVPLVLRSKSPQPIGSFIDRGVARAGSSPTPAATALPATASSPVTLPSIPSSVSTSSPPSTFSHHSPVP